MVEAMVFATLQAYTAARKEKHQLKKIGPDAQSTCEWGQIEIDRLAEEAINKI